MCSTEATILHALCVNLLDLYPSTLQRHYKTRKTLPEIWKVELLCFVVMCVIFLYIRVLFVPSKILSASLVIDLLVLC